uniref:ion channel n=1 Tax=Altererythrobacter segetis TaxID=1104773 RepID=UPI00140D135E|nr:ion channel [Altererythrobacter segetis]
MLHQLAIATIMVLLTVMIHGAGLLMLMRLLRIELHEEATMHLRAFSARTLAFVLALALGLFALHGVEIWAYAILYLGLGALPNLETAVFFSTITYSTVGYDDQGFAPSWQLVAAIEAINGVILLGWSTAFFFAIMTRLVRR